MIVDHAHQLHQVPARLRRAHPRDDLLFVGAGEEVGRHRRRHVRGAPRDGALPRALAAGRRVGGLHAVDHVHELGGHGEALRVRGVLVGAGRGLHGAALRVEEQVGRVEVGVALLALRGLRDEHLARAHDLGLQRELLERGDEARRLEDGGNGRADVAGGVGRGLEEDLGGVVLPAPRAQNAIAIAIPRARPEHPGRWQKWQY